MKVFLALVILLAGFDAQSQNQNRQEVFNLRNSLALEGYDPVSYFNGTPLEGEKQYSHLFKGILYYFADSKNRAIFMKEPEKFEPAYGGWCAYAMGESGEQVKVDPETYKIIDGRLYLFYNFWGNNTLSSWNKNEKSLKINADKNWTKIFH
jgi:YHS domain-containing protein